MLYVRFRAIRDPHSISHQSDALIPPPLSYRYPHQVFRVTCERYMCLPVSSARSRCWSCDSAWRLRFFSTCVLLLICTTTSIGSGCCCQACQPASWAHLEAHAVGRKLGSATSPRDRPAFRFYIWLDRGSRARRWLDHSWSLPPRTRLVHVPCYPCTQRFSSEGRERHGMRIIVVIIVYFDVASAIGAT